MRSANSCDCGKNYKRQLHQTPFHKSFLALSSTSGFGRVILEKQGSASIGGEPFRRRSAIYSVRSWLMPSLSPCRFAFLLLGKWPPLKNNKKKRANQKRLSTVNGEDAACLVAGGASFFDDGPYKDSSVVASPSLSNQDITLPVQSIPQHAIIPLMLPPLR